MTTLPEDMARFREQFDALMGTARSVMRHLGHLEEGDPELARIAIIKEVVADYYGLPTGALSSSLRTNLNARARQIAMMLCREFTKLTTRTIGEAFKRDHGTVSFACKSVTDQTTTDAKFAAVVNTLRLRCAGHFPEIYASTTVQNPS